MHWPEMLSSGIACQTQQAGRAQPGPSYLCKWTHLFIYVSSAFLVAGHSETSYPGTHTKGVVLH